MTYLWIVLGAVAGAPLRYFVASKVQQSTGADFPFGTLAVNVSGCLLIGLIATLADEREWLGREGRLLLLTGFLGSYTTFSAFGMETYSLATMDELGRAFLNVVGSVSVGLIAVWAGVQVAKMDVFATTTLWR